MEGITLLVAVGRLMAFGFLQTAAGFKNEQTIGGTEHPEAFFFAICCN